MLTGLTASPSTEADARTAMPAHARPAPVLMMVALLLAMLMLGAFWLSQGLVGKAAWPIAWVEVEGEFANVTAAQVRATVAAHVDGGFFSVNLGEIERAVSEMAWVADARVSRAWPDRLQVRVREHHPMAIWQAGGLIDTRGKFFAVPPAWESAGLPIIDAPQELRTDAIGQFMQIAPVLADNGQSLRRLKLSPRHAVTVELTSGVTVEAGSQTVMARLERLLGVMPDLLADPRGLAAVDLRYPNGLTATWQQAELDATTTHTEQQAVAGDNRPGTPAAEPFQTQEIVNHAPL